MRITVVGAGPTGLYLAMVLARRGHHVTVVDRDTGPQDDGSWPRRGVMQFHHPHAFRARVVEALQAELPEVWHALLVAGAELGCSEPGAEVAVEGLRRQGAVIYVRHFADDAGQAGEGSRPSS